MAGQPVLDVLVGLFFVFFVFSTLSSGVNELISRVLDKRARFLEAAIWQMLDRGESVRTNNASADRVRWFNDFWDHPLVRQLARPISSGKPARLAHWVGQLLAWPFRGGQLRAVERLRAHARSLQTRSSNDAPTGDNETPEEGGSPATTNGPEILSTKWGRPKSHQSHARPPYIPSETFALVVLDLLHHEGGTLPEGSPLAALVRALDQGVGVRTREGRQEIEGWFDGQMERVSGWYKREAKTVLFIIASLVVLVFNLDTIAVARTLWTQPTVRDFVTRTAQHALDQPNPSAPALTPTASAPTGSSSRSEEASGAATPMTSSITPLVCQAPPLTPTTTSAPTSTTTSAPPVRTELEAAADCARTLAAEGLPIGWRKPLQCAVRASKKGAPTTRPCKTFWDRVDDVFVSKWRDRWAKLLLVLAGWAISVGALSMGAPFWWDQLNRLGSLRSTGPKPS